MLKPYRSQNDHEVERALADIVRLNKQNRADPSQSFARLQALLAEDLVRVNHVILNRMESQVPLIPQLAGHIIASGGKRLRPMLTLAATRLAGYAGDRHIKLAACVEFIHTATLLHDDVVDESDLRRGKTTAHVLWGNQASVLVGDFLFSRAFQLMVEDGNLQVLDILSNASAVIAEGEVMQLQIANNTNTTEDAYLNVIAAKTAALFSAACRIGPVVAGRGDNEERAMESFGRNLGIVFQLTDDALDYSARQATLGKTVGDDFREGKITLPVLLAFRRGDDGERQFWRRCLEKGQQTDGDFEQALHYMDKHDALADTIERARHYGAIAQDALGIYPDTDMKRCLQDVVDFCITRTF